MPEILPRPGEAGAKGDPSISADPAGLARRPDFRLGDVDVRPSIRTVEGPGGVATAEPRVMQVLVALADARGAVLTRDDLLRLCWDGRIVGDDSINRAIAELRALARATDAGFVVETIPRIGYRLTETAAEGTAPGPARTASTAPVARRAMIGAALAVTAASVGGFSLWSARRTRADPRVADLLDRGRQALRDELPDRDEQGIGFLEEATRLAPDNAAAWGLLALAHRNVLENAPPGQTAAALRASERAARRALALDPRQGDALAALATLRPPFGDWLAAENRLLEVLRIAPDNLAAISALVTLLQSVGRRRESWTWNERAAALDPLSPVHQFRKALKHWIFGRVPDADLTIDRALQLWPRHAAVWNARLMIFAFTGRAPAGLDMIADASTRPATLGAPAIAVWRASLIALDTGAAADVSAARQANVEAAPRSPGFALNAIMVLSMLGELDAAFAVADGYLLRRGPLTGTLWTGAGQMPVNDQRWRRPVMMFTPATDAFRADPRFGPLCEGIGLADYWRRRGIGPDQDTAEQRERRR